MLTKYRANRAHLHACHQWNGFAFIEPSTKLCPLVYSILNSHQVIIEDAEILVVECGFVTMAVHADRAIEYDNAIVVPGVDSNGKSGFLVLREGALPFHSLSSNPIEACHESNRAIQSAQTLLAAYGDKKNLRLAARKAPWYKFVTEQDLVRSGLCAWGSESFLRRYGLWRFSRRFGLPRFILRLAGFYGERVIAASLLRENIDKSDEHKKHGP